MRSFDSWFNQTTRELAEIVEQKEIKEKKDKPIISDEDYDYYDNLCPIEVDPDYWVSTC